MRAIKFGRIRENVGKLVIEYRRTKTNLGGRLSVRVELIDGIWRDKNGRDYTADIERIELSKEIKKLESLCGK